MPTSPNLKDLFRATTAKDKLTLFQELFEAQLLTVDLTLALLKVIHGELSAEMERDRSAYKRYAETIETLRYHQTDVLQQVVGAWNENAR